MKGDKEVAVAYGLFESKQLKNLGIIRTVKSGPSPVIAPPTSKFNHFYHNQTSVYAVAKVFTSGPSQAAAIITIPEEIKIKI